MRIEGFIDSRKTGPIKALLKIPFYMDVNFNWGPSGGPHLGEKKANRRIMEVLR